jgi:hypothetical protein
MVLKPGNIIVAMYHANDTNYDTMTGFVLNIIHHMYAIKL